jgi:hypothetical protein
MQSFKQFSNLQESDTQKAYDMEHVIVSAAGGEPFISQRIPNSEKIGEKIISDLKLTGTGKFPKNTYPASKKWNQYFPGGAKGTTLTPKTDFLIGEKRISLKTGDGAQLMSGESKEATATFFTAVEKSGMKNDKMVMELGKHMKNLLPATDLRKLGIKGSKRDLQKTGKFIEVEILKRADDAHHAFKNDLRKVFDSNPSFAEAFTFEAMTGKEKFANSTGTAEYFLVTDWEGNAQLHNAFTDKGYVKKIAKQVNPDVRFKSNQIVSSAAKSKSNPKGGTGYYKFYSAIGLGLKMIVEEEVKYSNMLNEGIIDNIKNFVHRVIERAKKWYKNFIQQMKKIVGDSWQKLLEYMDIEPQVSFNNNINW